jgi:2-polyprenyl-6-methoxyphenol hydroxylase-like FAD-dependent oxidoreductase
MRALQKLGVGDDIAAIGTPLRSTEIWSSQDKLILALPVGEVTDERGAPTLAVARGELQLALSRVVPEGILRLGANCTSVEQDGDGVTAHFEDGSSERGVVLVGADGGRSVVRKHVYGSADAERRYSGVTAWRAVTRTAAPIPPPGTIRFYYGDGRQFTLAAIDGGRAFWGAVNTEPAGGSDPPSGLHRILAEHLRDFPEMLRQVVQDTPEDEIIRTDIYDRDPETTWVKGRVALLGDAAHLTTPFIGEGASITIEDAVALAKELALTGGLRDLSMLAVALQSYERVRLPRCSEIVLASRRLGQIYMSGNPILTRVRNTLMGRVPARARRKMIERSYQDKV